MNKAAQALGSLGGKARARSLSKARKREIASKAGKASAQVKRSAVVKKRLSAFYREMGGA